jgi:glutaminase
MDNHVRKTNARLKTTLFHDFLDEFHSTIKEDRSGEVASYIPELLQVNEDNFGIAIATVDGYVYQVGDTQVPFSIQSISKAFTYGLALSDKGADQVMQKVDVEPSGEAFNSISLEPDTGRPKNPMINAGAIAVTGLIDGTSSDEKVARILNVFSQYSLPDIF